MLKRDALNELALCQKFKPKVSLAVI